MQDNPILKAWEENPFKRIMFLYELDRRFKDIGGLVGLRGMMLKEVRQVLEKRVGDGKGTV